MENTKWMPLLDYAATKGISLSTLRRRIKANKIQYELRGGKYYIFDDGQYPIEDPQKTISDLKEEIADLKTYVKFLEEKTGTAQ
ncbi:MAG: hypothetical protein HY390_06380 [Deltaproteobacteria bacterium]|nr:hypothetical protein [Deltaproteobacteria bacterium]